MTLDVRSLAYAPGVSVFPAGSGFTPGWNRLIEHIKKKLIALVHLKWIVHFGWVKGHAGIEGNELVDRLAKETAVEDGPVVCDKIPKEVIVTRGKDHGLHMWEQQCRGTRKGAVTKVFSPHQ